ncbi:MAG TPA: UDP-glucose 4-epimerase, partial [Myxococcaceae bacterium]|nr:UDP-glucose 4-epimerase [Myxococcaceae bacterium]
YVGPLNIGTGIETDINRLYRLLAEAAGSQELALHQPAKPGEQMRSSVEASLAKKVLDWEPAVMLEQGLRQTVEYFRQKALGSRSKSSP